LVAHWGWLEEGSFRWLVLPLFNMATTAAILDLVSVDFLTNAYVNWSDFLVTHWRVINLHHIPLLPTLSSIYQQTTSHSGAYATPCVALVSKWNSMDLACFVPEPFISNSVGSVGTSTSSSCWV
jgi:hypothetical protein